MAAFVLVQGAFVGGWCWRWVTPYLRAAGHNVWTPTLTGLGERVHLASPRVDLETHIQDVVNTLSFDDLSDVVLVGWSYGGMVIAGVADRVPDRVAHVVYLDSDIPRNGETSAPPSRHAALVALAREHGDGWQVPPSAVFSRLEGLLLRDLPEGHKTWVVERLTPHPVRCWTQPITLVGGVVIPTTYIRCTIGHDPTDEDTKRQEARIQSEPGWRYRELAVTHAAPWTAPETVAGVLLEVV